MGLLDRLFGRSGAATKAAAEEPDDRHLRLGDDLVVYAVGDVHGCLDPMLDLERRIAADAAAHGRPTALIYLGDVIDRGPDGAAVLDHLTGRDFRAGHRYCLIGNHEAMLLQWLDDPADDAWLDHGGTETLVSYGIGPAALAKAKGKARATLVASHIPAGHLAFLRSLPLTIEAAGHLFVHAGVNPDRDFAGQREDDFLWIREPFLSRPHRLPLRVVHGHTPADEPVVLDHRIGIDIGAYATGRLCAVRIAADAPPAFLISGGRTAQPLFFETT
ncbi:metallophosphoesterase [Mongoliimonas terrestris]|uniref:metallophosphoesterase n=1 Tax=Mongoliimonas terrestris TaxID=1709001 RepID=UPI000949A3F2|nr:metallophosphoesterase [Mongoliimonas terrestris]